MKKHRSANDADEDSAKSVFTQLTAKISEFSLESLCLPHRIWKVKFIGESVDDCGGGFSESIAEICDELQNGSLPLLIATPNSKEEGNTLSDYFIVNPTATEKKHKEMFRFLGLFCFLFYLLTEVLECLLNVGLDCMDDSNRFVSL